MLAALQVGDRIRVTATNGVPGYSPGETGRVMWVSRLPGTGEVTFYHCRVDRTGDARIVAFYPHEVEPDG